MIWIYYVIFGTVGYLGTFRYSRGLLHMENHALDRTPRQPSSQNSSG